MGATEKILHRPNWTNRLWKLKCFHATLVLSLVALCLTASLTNVLPTWHLDIRTLTSQDGGTLPNLIVSKLQHERPLPPLQHVYYLKTHKTGSSSIFAILAEYCRSHDLRPLLPSGVHINQGGPLLPEEQLMLDPQVKHYDMVFNHHVYDPAIFRYLHNDTFKFTTLREPFEQFVSSFTYFSKLGNIKYLISMNGYRDPISVFLSNPKQFEPAGYYSYTNNRQSIDLGYKIDKHSFSDKNYTQKFIKETGNGFDLVLITEYFLESIILLKRALNWQTQDVVFNAKNVFRESKSVLANMTQWHRKQHRKFSVPDIKLYQHFLSVFKLRMSQAVGLDQEVSEFKDILKKVRKFCSHKAMFKDKNKKATTKLEVPARRWSDRVAFSRSKCKWLNLQELFFTKHLQKLQSYRMKPFR